MSLNWDDLQVLLALVRAGSLTRASSLLGVDQSTVGRRLSALEASLGTTLFLRSKSGILATEVGEKLIADAIEIERRANKIIETASAVCSEPTGELQILGDHWVLEHLVNKFLPNLLTTYPTLEIRLCSGASSTSSWTAATISLWFENSPQMGDFAIKLVDVPFAVYSARDCSGEAVGWVTMRDDSTTRRAPAKFMEKIRERNEPVHIVGNDPRFLQQAVKHGMGKGLLPMCLAETDPDLRRIDTPGFRIDRTLNLHAHPDTVQTKRVQTAIRHLREQAEKLFSFAAEDEIGT
ncbi:DNA-binding transcriptional LysR family regulator [Labrenzia sp. EL_208]|nr:DNA-binding transcriptional LysR family regulator [Labrenzia sp. EL_132]MBG6230837.1 DNA-binding transcriptional LysR family regulator [Labrenzia sp. EL_208]